MMALAANNVSVSEALGQACLLQDGVRRVARLNVSVHSESFARDRAFPNLVIAIALPVEPAARCPKEFLQFPRETRHARRIRRARDALPRAVD